jgi:hypothetical protein
MNSPFKGVGPVINTDDGIKAAKIAVNLANMQGILCAICGGLSMHLYGFTRATKDIDVIADRELNLNAEKKLSFGGNAYLLKIDNVEIELDWIIRDDELSELYQASLNDRIFTDDGLPIISPEWLVILKHLAGRGKDHMDCVWLLRQDGLVDRELTLSHVKKIMGKHAYWAIKDLESLILEADLMKARDLKNDK